MNQRTELAEAIKMILEGSKLIADAAAVLAATLRAEGFYESADGVEAALEVGEICATSESSEAASA